MTELLSAPLHNGERRSCEVTGQHLRLAMLAAGIEYQEVRSVADEAGVFETDITRAFAPLLEAGLIELGPDFYDQLTPEGEAFVAEGTDAMRAAHQVVAGLTLESL